MQKQYHLTDGQLAELGKELTGKASGGFQDLFRSLSATRQGDVQTIDEAQAEKLVRYTTQYGGGGFEERLRTLLVQVRKDFNL